MTAAGPSVVIDGVAVPEKLIAQEISHHPAASLAEARIEAARALAIRALLLNRARGLDLDANPQVDDDGREETRDEALIRVLLDQEVQVDEPTQDERRRVYDAAPDRFMTPTMIEASHILLQPPGEDDADWSETEAQANVLIERLSAQPGLFADLARELSQCSSRDVGGALGQLFPGDLTPEVERALTDLAPGQIGDRPVRSRFGWHVLRLDRRQPGRRLPFEHVQADIAERLRHRAWAGAAARYVAALADDARETGVALTLDEAGQVAPGALSFGDLMGDGEALALRSERWLASADPDLAELARSEAERRSQPMAAFVRETLAAFLAQADDEVWTRLISVAQGADDPALACAQSILRQTLAPPAKTFTLIRRR